MKLQVMWSAPFNHDHYDNWFGIGIGKDRASSELFRKFYSQEIDHFNRGAAQNHETPT